MIPLGLRQCEMCGTPTGAAAKQAWQPPIDAPPVQLHSSAASWAQTAPPPAQVADQGIALPSTVSVAAIRAPFWMRVVALIIDNFVVGIPAYALSVVILQQGPGGRYGISVLLSLMYFAYFWSAPEKGQTLGMSLFNLHVVRTDGSYLDGGKAFVRFIGFLVAQLPLGLGLLWAAFDPNKQGWHDKIAGTYVIRAAS